MLLCAASHARDSFHHWLVKDANVLVEEGDYQAQGGLRNGGS